MNTRNEWMSVSGIQDLYHTQSETIDMVVENFDIRRFYSNEGFDAIVDGVTERVLIQNYTNPLNQNKLDKKIFLSKTSAVKRGSYIQVPYFNNNIFLVNSKVIDNTAYLETRIVECNNTLKFYDKSGILHQIPCVATNKLEDLENGKIVTLQDNQLGVVVQYNNESKLIQWQNTPTRFILNEEPWVVEGFDKQTEIINGVGIMTIRLKSDVIKPEDDVINGIADANIATSPAPTNAGWEIVINGNSTLKQGSQSTYTAVVYNNGVVDATKNVVWSVNDLAKVSVINSTGTSITIKGLVSSGSVSLTSQMVDIPTVTQTMNITLKSLF